MDPGVFYCFLDAEVFNF
ncbi:hypothetical protein [Escherichia coli]